MAEHVLKYIPMIIPILIGGYNIGEAVKRFIKGKYFMGGISSMVAIWMICLFIMTFFEL